MRCATDDSESAAITGAAPVVKHIATSSGIEFLAFDCNRFGEIPLSQ